MIVTAVPGFKQIVREVWKPLLVLAVWDVVVTAVYFLVWPFAMPALPLTLFGSAIALFLGFRSNSAYQRWWEGRVLWGAMINASRNLARQAGTYLSPGARRAVVLSQIAYVHTLRCQLRRVPIAGDPYHPGALDAALARTNGANGILDSIGARVAAAHGDGAMDSMQQASIERVLVDIANAQGGMERLKNTPLPNQYRFFPVLFTHLLCLLLPIGLVETLGYATPLGSTVAGLMFLAVLAIGDDLVDPFANTVHDLPLDAMCRTIEIDLLQGLGDPAPEPLVANARGVLW